MAVVPERRTLVIAGIGTAAGLFSGLFGVGGGVVMVPLLILLLGMDERRATATSLAAIVLIASAATVTQGAYGKLHVVEGLLVGVPAVAGVLVGTWVQQRIPARRVSLLFALLLAVVAALMVAGVEPGGDDGGTRDALQIAAAIAIGLAAGVVSGLLGVGGGSLFVPGLALLLGLPHVDAEATSLLAIVPVSLVGSWRQHRYGNLDLRVGALLGTLAIPGALLGVVIVNAIPSRAVEIGFAALLLFVSSQLGRRGLGRDDPPDAVADASRDDPFEAPTGPAR
ncbi:hypothetical protein PAI11_32800 [Patulibacter medicamentivorans]|uniref:Probable membrane transporter protein n=1 Tax=Patulibacter medicamentivorans TaxID=1097667 RepID=H0E8W6_9ACTN|nr:hypothetical protein PAI11_32800 [Patulibacter medicamentivorans]